MSISRLNSRHLAVKESDLNLCTALYHQIWKSLDSGQLLFGREQLFIDRRNNLWNNPDATDSTDCRDYSQSDGISRYALRHI